MVCRRLRFRRSWGSQSDGAAVVAEAGHEGNRGGYGDFGGAVGFGIGGGRDQFAGESQRGRGGRSDWFVIEGQAHFPWLSGDGRIDGCRELKDEM